VYLCLSNANRLVLSLQEQPVIDPTLGLALWSVFALSGVAALIVVLRLIARSVRALEAKSNAQAELLALHARVEALEKQLAEIREREKGSTAAFSRPVERRTF
jgi:uncharacterized membrane protein